ncbi:hypothetical protein [Singapore grouper iridovirus]|nr:hypothetical protein [Singapore grouper iridovirus]
MLCAIAVIRWEAYDPSVYICVHSNETVRRIDKDIITCGNFTINAPSFTQGSYTCYAVPRQSAQEAYVRGYVLMAAILVVLIATYTYNCISRGRLYRSAKIPDLRII